MRKQTLLTGARDLLALFIHKVEGSKALGFTDLNKISEGFVLELFRELFSLPALRDLNEEQENFPGLDLGDDTKGIAFQVTAT